MVAKRADVSHHHHGANSVGHSITSTRCYVSFSVESGERMERNVPDSEYGFLMEGDQGRLSFQGTR